jgi:hypothetical protein
VGPLSLFTFPSLHAGIQGLLAPPANPPTPGMTLLQVQSLNHLGMGNIRPAAFNVLSLRRGIRGYGHSLFKAYFHPWRLRSILSAQRLCLEAARTRFGFDLLFVERGPEQDQLHVRCPDCHAYWPWREGLPNDLRTAAGRRCPRCAAR